MIIFVNRSEINQDSTQMQLTAEDEQDVEMGMFTHKAGSVENKQEHKQQQSAVVTLVTSSEIMLFYFVHV